MKRMDTEKRQEVVIYGILWGIVFLLVPAVMLLQGRSNDPSFQLKELFRIWLGILPFFLLFLFHDLLAAPLWACCLCSAVMYGPAAVPGRCHRTGRHSRNRRTGTGRPWIGGKRGRCRCLRTEDGIRGGVCP